MFEHLLEAIAQGLERLGIPYMLIGGQAVLLYGEPRMTRDIDITLGVGPERLSELLDWVGRNGWQVLVEPPEEFVVKTMVLPCLDPVSGIRLDLIFSFSAYEPAGPQTSAACSSRWGSSVLCLARRPDYS